MLKTLTEIAKKYPPDLVKEQIEDIPRISFNIKLVLDSAKSKPVQELSICDLGGGIGLFSVGLAALGIKRTVLVDDFNDSVNNRFGDSILGLHRKFGVEAIERDVIKDGIKDIKEKFDVITSFNSMEHWHNSPKELLHEAVEKLNEGGALIIGVPNCVNLRKRLTVPFGFGKWSRMQDWYEEKKFRGHVREPDIDDLLYIARDLGLSSVKIYGRNWLGCSSKNQMTKFAARAVDLPIRLFPSICSDIYLVGKIKNS